MAPLHQQQTSSSATSSRNNPQESTNDTKPQRSKKKQTEPIASPVPRRPDEIEEVESVAPRPIPARKPKPNRVESSEDEDDDDDDDDVESVYLSDDESADDNDTSEEDSDDSDDSVESIPPRQLTRRSTGRVVKHSSPSPNTVVQTRSETTHWITAQQPQGNNGAITRGTRTLQQQTTMHGQNLNTQQRTRSGGNSLRFNMSIDVNMSFSGLVTGRNLSFAGGQMSYAWSRRNTQGS